MQQRNTLFGAVSLVVAGAAIGAGAIASSNAMADTGTPPPGATVHVVTLSGDGSDAISCEFDDVALPTLASAAVPADVLAPTGEGVEGGVVSVTGSVTGSVSVSASADAGGPSFTVGGSGPIEVHGAAGGDSVTGATPGAGSLLVDISGSGELPPDVIANGLPDGAVVLDAADARPGTAEECAAIRETFVPAP